MIIGNKTTGLPVPGIEFAGRKVFVEVFPMDNEVIHARIGMLLCCANKLFAELLASDPANYDVIVTEWLNRWNQTGCNVTFTKQVNHDELKATILEG